MAKLGLQLYTVREDAERDLVATMQRVADMGYTGVEFAGGIRRMATAADLRGLLDETGLEVAGAVFNYAELKQEFSAIVEYCRRIGCPTLVIPWIDEKLRPDAAGWQAVAAGFNAIGAAARAEGLQLLYHVHGFEFSQVEGRTGMDWLASTCNHDLVKLEIDVYWVEHAGVDAVSFMREHGAWCAAIHFKDMVDRITRQDVEVGDGCIDMDAIARIGKEHAVPWFIVEQEQYTIPPLASAAISLTNLRRIVG
jgi:sugar phosphate isomerase/epimerase